MNGVLRRCGAANEPKIESMRIRVSLDRGLVRVQIQPKVNAKPNAPNY